MKTTLSNSGRVPPELRWTVWFGGFFSRPIVRNNIARLAEALAVLHLWLSGTSFGIYAADGTNGRWSPLCLLIGGLMWLIIARKMREKFAVMDAERDRFLKSVLSPPNDLHEGRRHE